MVNAEFAYRNPLAKSHPHVSSDEFRSGSGA
jgi:hypothetical protein